MSKSALVQGAMASLVKSERMLAIMSTAHL